ncbi:methyltransferase domain-containing protein [Streptomyces gilvosporeus]|uniref:SAM-dependent methyltransferase n=1 Tax=Streptomyces gilvosporeus TaxID=553510 RepID=A0A1V0TYU2_9ACTN|nr:SAM-dependent methyltransferase [Streptomyces gilvosporeus]
MNATTHRAPTWGADPYADALRSGRGPLFLRRADGWLLPLEVERWCGGTDAADRSALRRCKGGVLDIGCGPGRLVAALAAQGRRALGIDVSEAAVARTAAIGGSALCRSVFDPLPDEGHWGTALLLDGNIGIGGDPRALLLRTAELLAPRGTLIVETTAADVDERVEVQVDGGSGAAGGFFPWARVGTPALLRYAAEAGWAPAESWSVPAPPDQRPDSAERRFVALRRRTRAAVPRSRGPAARADSTSADRANSPAVSSSQRARKSSPGRPVTDV